MKKIWELNAATFLTGLTLSDPLISGPGGRYEVDGCPGTEVVAPSLNLPPRKVPKRVQVVNFWAQRRVVSRIFLMTMVAWIALFIYKAGVVEYIIRGAGYMPRDRSPTIEIPTIKSTESRQANI